MTTYHAILTQIPAITPDAHTITLSIYRPSSDPLHPAPTSIGTLTFAKDPDETWPHAATRLHQAVQNFIATYEQRIHLNIQISAWLRDQRWTT